MKNIQPGNAQNRFKFLLYVSGGYPNSERAVSNLRKLCTEHIPDRHEFEIVDVLADPQRALADGVQLTPLLLKLSPEPVQRFVGSLNLTETVLQALGLPGLDAA